MPPAARSALEAAAGVAGLHECVSQKNVDGIVDVRQALGTARYESRGRENRKHEQRRTEHQRRRPDAAGKVRLYEVAKDLGLANKDLVAKVRALGIEVKNHMSNLDPDDVARVKRALDKERQANLVEERLSSTVIRRR